MTECIHLTHGMRRRCLTCNPYPYTHAGPAIHGSKLMDYLLTEARMIEDADMVDTAEPTQGPGLA